MAISDGSDGTEPDASQKKGFDISSLLKPVAEVDTAIGKLFLFPLSRSDISAFNDISTIDQSKRIREFLPFIASLSPDYSWEKERSGVTHDQVQSLLDPEVEELAEAYTLSNALRSAREGGKDRKPIVRDANESPTAFLDRLLRSEVEEQANQFRKLTDQALGPTQRLFDQVRNSSAILGSTLTEFERLSDRLKPAEISASSTNHFQVINEQYNRQARERAEELETVRLTGKMTAESAHALKDLVEAAATLMEQMDERDRKSDESTRTQITVAVWAVGISAVLSLLALIVSGFGYLQDQDSIISGDQWQAKMLTIIEQGAEQRSVVELENQELRERVKSLDARIEDLEADKRAVIDASETAYAPRSD
ncbi:hypothetical protein CUU95_10860 [Vreelandella alkaliphila]|uniref:hypothetical protein n=1 Tax=Vreelandella alkaliphila TaxID=272774 RepID=UPI000EA20C6F|nr:hypothetical protein [Halomonas alkaliphila]AYF34273.1 hypothetical protein CUU95_10860 [Halomonas alkaliphila]